MFFLYTVIVCYAKESLPPNLSEGKVSWYLFQLQSRVFAKRLIKCVVNSPHLKTGPIFNELTYDRLVWARTLAGVDHN